MTTGTTGQVKQVINLTPKLSQTDIELIQVRTCGLADSLPWYARIVVAIKILQSALSDLSPPLRHNAFLLFMERQESWLDQQDDTVH